MTFKNIVSDQAPKIKKDFFLQGLVKESFKSRLWITILTLFTFLMIILGIGHSLVVETELHQEWKEILLLVLGAFIGSYNRVIDFWFNSSERDREVIARADNEDNPLVYSTTEDTTAPAQVEPFMCKYCQTKNLNSND